MHLRITEREGRALLLFKLVYLIPFIIIAYIPVIIIEGIKEVGNPFGTFAIVKRTWNKAKDN